MALIAVERLGDGALQGVASKHCFWVDLSLVPFTRVEVVEGRTLYRSAEEGMFTEISR